MKSLSFLIIINAFTLTTQAYEAIVLEQLNPNFKIESPYVQTVNSIIKKQCTLISGEKNQKHYCKLFKPGFKLIPSGKNCEGKFTVQYLVPDDDCKNSEKWLEDHAFSEGGLTTSTEHKKQKTTHPLQKQFLNE